MCVFGVVRRGGFEEASVLWRAQGGGARAAERMEGLLRGRMQQTAELRPVGHHDGVVLLTARYGRYGERDQQEVPTRGVRYDHGEEGFLF